MDQDTPPLAENVTLERSVLQTRREFLNFLGRSATSASLATWMSSSCTSRVGPKPRSSLPFQPLEPTREDTLKLASGFRSQLVLEHGQTLNSKGDRFGYNNDFISAISIPNSPEDLLLWVNHESVDPMLLHGKGYDEKPTRDEAERERREVGASMVRVRRSPGGWKLVENDPLNRRLDATSAIPLVGGGAVQGRRVANGTLANCSGGRTPWGTVLTCEENYDHFYGERDRSNGERILSDYPRYWQEHFDEPPEHYGWVVEVDPFTGVAKKLLPLGRFAHECATIRTTKDGRCVVYSGDDRNFGCLYKFVSDSPGTLLSGTLYVADLEAGRWLSLERESNAKLEAAFVDQTDLWIHARRAGEIAGGSRLDRPEDIAIDPGTGAVLIALTNNTKRGNFYGSILRIREAGGEPDALEFDSEEFFAGGTRSGVACPDNLAFDSAGNMWMTNDMKGEDLTTSRYRRFGNNALFYIPMFGIDAGQAFRVASAPMDAELTGPCFSPDGSTLFLSVQHPGETTPGPGRYSSHWPHGGSDKPKPAVVAISGPALTALLPRANKAALSDG